MMSWEVIERRAGRDSRRWTDGDRALLVIAAALFLFCAPALLRAALTVPVRAPLDYNEGWNAYHTDAAFSPRGLYPDPPRLFFTNYPPLSFVIVGAAARATGDAIVAGRIISLLSFGASVVVLFYAARRMQCGRAESAFGAALFAAYMLTFSSYVGVDDPELLAHAIQGAGLLLLLRAPRTTARLVCAAGLLSLGVFVKLNAFALPIAAAVWLLMVDRTSGRRLIAAGAALGIAGAMLCVLVFGPRFLAEVFAARAYSSADVARCALRWVIRMPVFIAALIVLVRRKRDDPDVLLCAVYAVIATVSGLLLLGGAAVDWNVMFDSNEAFCLSASLALHRLRPASVQVARPRQLALAGAYIVVLLLGTIIGGRREWASSTYWLTPRRTAESDAARDIEFLRAANGPAFCEELALCYWAGKPQEVDLFNLEQRIRLGSRTADEVLSLVEWQYFGAIQLPPGRSYFDDRFAGVLSKAYTVDHVSRYGLFFVRRAPQARGPQSALPSPGPQAPSNSQPCLQLPHAIARDVELGLLLVLQPDQHAAVDRGEELLHEGDVDDCRAMNAHEAPRIQARFELRQRVVDDVLVTVDDRERELVLGREVADPRDLQHRRPLADA
jgi:hypothetical protein